MEDKDTGKDQIRENEKDRGHHMSLIYTLNKMKGEMYWLDLLKRECSYCFPIKEDILTCLEMCKIYE